MSRLWILCLTFILSWGSYSDAQDAKFDPPNDFKDSLNRARFQRRMRAETYEQQVAIWNKKCNPSGTFPNDLLEALQKNNIVIESSKEVVATDKVSQFGLSVESSLHDRNPKIWERISDNIRKKCRDKNVIDASADLVLEDLLTSIRQQFSREFDSLTWRVKYSIKNLPETSDEKKLSRQCWMLLEVFPSAPEHPVFPRLVAHELMLSGERVMVIIKPHPEEALLAEQLGEFLSKPLLANRKPPMEGFAPDLPPLIPDGQTCEQREKQLNFCLLDESNNQTQFQMEQITWDTETEKLFESSSSFLQQLHRRIPPGKVVSYEELHQICGEFVESFRVRHDAALVFTIEPKPHGKFSYEMLRITAAVKTKID